MAAPLPVTPIEPLDHLAAALGLPSGSVLIKRDDLIGLAGGGNKVRKNLVSIDAAVASGARAVITTGAPQSNHVRVVAGLAARAGLAAVLVLEGSRPERAAGNVVLDGLFGAELVWAGQEDAGAVADRLQAESGAFRVSFGGSDARSADAYRVAGEEILRQAPDLTRVVTAVGSGGTMAGLVRALGAGRVLGVDTGAVDDARVTVGGLLAAMGAGVPGASLDIDDAQVGSGYARLQPAVLNAMRLLARSEAIVVDPVYTGRMLAGFVDRVRSGRIARDDRTVLLHSGGLPGVFGHAEAAAIATV